MNRRQREVLALLQGAGADRVEQPRVTRGGHLCIQVRARNGVVRKFFASSTPGDYRGNLNILAVVRQFCRQNND